MSSINAPDFANELQQKKWSDVMHQTNKLQNPIDRSAMHSKEYSFLSVLTDTKTSTEKSKRVQTYRTDVNAETTTKKPPLENKKQTESADKKESITIEVRVDKPLVAGRPFLTQVEAPNASSEPSALQMREISIELPIACADDSKFDVYAQDSKSASPEYLSLVNFIQPEMPMSNKGIQILEREVPVMRMHLLNPNGAESDGLNERELVLAGVDQPKHAEVKKPEARIDTILKSIQAAAPLEMHQVSIVASYPAHVSITPILVSSFLFNAPIPEDVDFEAEGQEMALFVDVSTNQKQLLNKNAAAETKGGSGESFSGGSEHHSGQISTTATDVSIQKALAVQQMMQTFRARINDANLRNSGNTSINVQLTHQTLGDVDVQLKIKDNKVSAKFFGEKKEMQNLLRQNISNIESILTEAGLFLDSDPIRIYQKEI